MRHPKSLMPLESLGETGVGAQAALLSCCPSFGENGHPCSERGRNVGHRCLPHSIPRSNISVLEPSRAYFNTHAHKDKQSPFFPFPLAEEKMKRAMGDMKQQVRALSENISTQHRGRISIQSISSIIFLECCPPVSHGKPSPPALSPAHELSPRLPRHGMEDCWGSPTKAHLMGIHYGEVSLACKHRGDQGNSSWVL